MVAADRRIGGFNGSWGSGDAIDRKRVLLEGEGVLFESDGVHISEASLHRFGVAAGVAERKQPPAQEIPAQEMKPLAQRKRKRAESANARLEATSASADAQLEASIMALVRERGADKTC